MIKTKKEVSAKMIEKVIDEIKKGNRLFAVYFHNEYLDLKKQSSNCAPCIALATAAVVQWLKENNHATFNAPVSVISEQRPPGKSVWAIKNKIQ